jgi:hypothetical protein
MSLMNEINGASMGAGPARVRQEIRAVRFEELLGRHVRGFFEPDRGIKDAGI